MAFISGNSILLILFIWLASLVPHIHARIAEFDAYLEKQALEDLNSSLEAYTHNPEEVTNAFNKEVGNALLKYKSLRRNLKEKNKCMATNPIDRCWRCDKNWAENRMDLEECARGFGHKTTGGKNGKYYVVTDESDDNVQEPKPGTLRHAVIQEEPLWIIFEKSMVIKLQQELMITSDKTIDGRGVAVHIANGAGLTIQFVHNVIIHNIRIQNIISTNGGMIRDSVNHIGLRTVSDGDGISIFGSNHIWIDHCTLSECTDGLVDAIMASTAITISNCKFNHHNDVMLLGATDAFPQDSIMQVTVAFNRFGEGLIQRMPRCRWGFFHVVNNDYTHWQMYAIGGSAHPTIISQGNRFKAADNPNTKQVTKRDYAPESEWKKWQWVSEGDSFLNGAYFVESGPQDKKKTALTKNHKIKFKPGSHAGRLTRFAGVLKCKPGIPC
ncbi:pectate lyase-like [Solanum tuberosum]|uniref:Pectate lyase n=2 Tax=Solanum tuberosum TaxID=4113 RepID=M0ZJT8_SOLTU|nr:PREDICTED: pectate lyase-like [Solanum tuberosum]